MYRKILGIILTAALLGCGNNNNDKETRYEDFSYQYLSDIEENTFEFASGVGAWSTSMTINPDGSFEGEYSDTDMGVSNDEYPRGTCYYCKFSGQLGDLEKIDDLTYKTTLMDLSWENEADTEEIIDGTRFVYTTPYGIGEGGDIYFYLPGTEVETLTEEALRWLNYRLILGGYNEEPLTKLPCCILYESETEYTWNN